MRKFVAAMLALADEFVCFPPLKIVQDNTFVVAEFHSIIVKNGNDGLNPCHSFFEVSNTMYFPGGQCNLPQSHPRSPPLRKEPEPLQLPS